MVGPKSMGCPANQADWHEKGEGCDCAENRHRPSLHLGRWNSFRMGSGQGRCLIQEGSKNLGPRRGAGDVPAGTAVVATSVNRLKAAPPHFDRYVEAPAPNIIVRRLPTSERTLTPAKGIISSKSRT